MRTFTRQQANQLISELSQIVGKLSEKRQQFRNQHQQLLMLELVSHGQGIAESSAQDYLEKSRQLDEMVLSFEQDLIQLSALGVLLRDAEEGLVDIPFINGGETAYYSWKQGEREIQFWHERHEDYYQRRAL